MPVWRDLHGRMAALPAARQPARRWACRRVRWATAKSATSTWAPGSRSSRTCRASIGHRRRHASRPTRSCAPPVPTRRARDGRLHLWGSSVRAAFTPSTTTCWPWWAWPTTAACPPIASCSTPSPMDATRRPIRPRASWRRWRSGWPGGPRSRRCRVGSGPWTATSGWDRTELAFAAIARGEGDDRAGRGCGHRRRVRGGRGRRVRRADRGAAGRRHRSRRRRRPPELPRRSGSPADPGPGPAALLGLRARTDGRAGDGRDPDPVPVDERAASPGRLPAGHGPWAGRAPVASWGSASSTWPRPRSTPT